MLLANSQQVKEKTESDPGRVIQIGGDMDYRGSELERKRIASQLSHDIRLFNRLAKASDNPRRKRKLYELKHKRLSRALSHFSDYFSVVQVEMNIGGTLLVLIGLSNGQHAAHAPFNTLTEDARDHVRSVLLARLAAPTSAPHLPLAA